MSKPVIGMIIGLIAGAVIGLIAVFYFDVTDSLNRLCLIGCCLLVSQLLGATIAATVGKPHQLD